MLTKTIEHGEHNQIYIMRMKPDTIKVLTSCPETASQYGDLLARFADKPEQEREELIHKLQIPHSWKALLPEESELFYAFGFMPAEFWAILLSARADLAGVAKCFEAGRAGLICAKLESADELEFMKSNFGDSACAGFYWVAVLSARPEYGGVAEKCDAWKTITRCCPFALPEFLCKRPHYAPKFEPYKFWKFFGESDWGAIEKARPELLKYRK